MKRRQLGRSGIAVPPLCFGGNVFGWTADEKTSFAILDGLADAELNFIDTANNYSMWVKGHVGGESEGIIGRWMKDRRNRHQVIIATKVGWDLGDSNKGLSAAYILKAIDESLRRLQTDYVDLYQSHKDDNETPQEETLGAYAKLIEAGKIRAIGCSNFSPERLNASLEVSEKLGLPRYESLQPEYNLYSRAGYETELEAICRKQDIGVISFFSLASGFLTGKYRSENDFSKSPRGPWHISKYLNDRGVRILEALDHISRERGVSQSQIALAWLMARPGLTAPIASISRTDQLADLIASTRLELSDANIHELTSASAH